MVDRVRGLSAYDRLRVISDAHGALRHELEIVRAIADTDHPLAINAEPVASFDECVAFTLGVHDRADDASSQLAVRDLEAVRSRVVEVQLRLQAVRNVRKPA